MPSGLVHKDALFWRPMRQNAVAVHQVVVPLTLIGIPVLKEKGAPALLPVFHKFALISPATTVGIHPVAVAQALSRCGPNGLKHTIGKPVVNRW